MSTPPSSKTSASPIPKSRLAESSPNRLGSSASTGQGLARNPSLRSARPIRKGPTRASIGPDAVPTEEDDNAVNVQIIADLKEQVERAEQASREYRNQLEAMQRRLDEVSNEITAAEERELQFRTQIDQLQAEMRDAARQNRDMELSYESDKKLLLRDHEAKSSKEAELQSIVSRLTETLKLKNQELANAGKRDLSERHQADSGGRDGGGIDNDGSNGQDYFKILEQKNNTIETLRLEIAGFHVKMTEQEHQGDGRSQALEKELLDIKMRNARLQEENESFQMLLSEKTLKGDFMHDQSALESATLSSLAEELESAENLGDNAKKFEIENRALKDSNKALTLYIDKIIGRLLTHEGFEHIITDKDEDLPGIQQPPYGTKKSEKALPDIPQPDARRKSSVEPDSLGNAPTNLSSATSTTTSLLQRARSVVSRPAQPKSRPISYVPSAPTANENPVTAPSIPINRTHRRARSDQANEAAPTSTAPQSNRGSPLRAISGGATSPPTSMPATRLSFAGLGTAPLAKTPSATGPHSRPMSSSNSMTSDQSHDIEQESTDASSARASVYGSNIGGLLPGAVMKQNQLRPLRLVQEKVQADEEVQKKANRGSWMGWFNKGPSEQAPE